MSKTTRVIAVRFIVEVEMDDAAFTPEFMSEFSEVILPGFTLEDHAEYIAWLECRGLLRPDFTEGYGPLAPLGISARIISDETEVTKP